MTLIKTLLINLSLSIIFASKIFFVKPVAFVDYTSSGADYMVTDSPITIVGAGLNAYFKKNKWTIYTEYIQLGLLGEIDKTIFDFSPRQSFPYLDDSKDADGYWSEYATARIKYISDNF